MQLKFNPHGEVPPTPCVCQRHCVNDHHYSRLLNGNLTSHEQQAEGCQIGHFQIYHNTLFRPSKILHKLVSSFSWDLRHIENNACAKFWRDEKEYYGKFEMARG